MAEVGKVGTEEKAWRKRRRSDNQSVFEGEEKKEK
jgi:hypothetical protein